MVYVGGCGRDGCVRFASSWGACGWCWSEELMMFVHVCMCVLTWFIWLLFV